MLCLADEQVSGIEALAMTVAPILLLLVSALITWLIRNRHTRTQWVVSSLLGFVVWALMLFIDVEAMVPFQLSIWQPRDLFLSPISLIMDSTNWPLSYGAVTVLLAVILTAAARPKFAQAGIRSFWFLYTALALAAIMAANLLTVTVAWALIDFGTLFFLMGVSTETVDRQTIFVRAGVNFVSVLLIVAAAMTSEIQGIVALELTSTSAAGIFTLAIAATFRLGLIPLRFSLPKIAPIRRGAGTLLRLFPPVIAMALLARVFAAGLPEVLRIVVLVAGSVGGLLGAARWLMQADSVQARPFYVLGLASLGVIVAANTEQGSQVIVAAGLMMLLVGAVLSLFTHHTPSHRLVPLLASILLIGLPFTPAGVYAAAANVQNTASAPIVSVIAIVITGFLALGCFHLFFSVESEWPVGESLARVMYNVGLILPILAAVGVGIWRMRVALLDGLIFSLAALMVAVLSYFFIRRLSSQQADSIRNAFARFEPDIFYETIWGQFNNLLGVIRRLGELLEGASGMLWVFVIIIIILFVIR